MFYHFQRLFHKSVLNPYYQFDLHTTFILIVLFFPTVNIIGMARSILGLFRSIGRYQRGLLYLGRWQTAMVGRCQTVRVSPRVEARAPH